MTKQEGQWSVPMSKQEHKKKTMKKRNHTKL